MGLMSAPAWSDSAPESASAPEQAETAVAELTDVQLTDLAADWSTLDDSQRTELIQETRQRMRPEDQSMQATQSAQATSIQGSAAQARVDAQRQTATPQTNQRRTIERRRYGRLVRKADGSVVRIETQVVRIQGGDPRRAYGVGFERRHGQPSVPGAPSARPGGPDASKRNDVIAVQGPNSAPSSSQ